jgi:hypothetical protein
MNYVQGVSLDQEEASASSSIVGLFFRCRLQGGQASMCGMFCGSTVGCTTVSN